MTARPADQRHLPKKDRKALARELARIEREREVRRRRRHRRLGWTGAGVATAAVAVVALLVVQASARAALVGPANMRADGIVLSGDGTAVTAARSTALDAGEQPTATAVDRTGGVLDLVLYTDYASADAATFWAAGGDAVQQWVTAGYATLEVHPLALEDDATGDYAARAAGALACVADAAPDSALPVHTALLAAQPDLGADGLSDDELVTLVQDAGITDPAVAGCITDGDFTDWAADATDRAAAGVPFDVGSVRTSPVLLVGGEQYTGALDDADALLAFVEDVAARLAQDAAADDAATAAPTDAATDAATDG